MPQISKENESSLGYRKPTTIDREQLEYTFTRVLSYSLLIFAAVGVCASVAHMTVQQLKK
jgi:hypothetical protein